MKTSWNNKLRTFCSREYRPHVQRISLLSTCISRIGCVKRSTIPGTMFAMDRRVAATEKKCSMSGKNWWKDRIDILCNCFSLFCFIDEGGSSEKTYISHTLQKIYFMEFFFLFIVPILLSTAIQFNCSNICANNVDKFRTYNIAIHIYNI